MNKIFSLITLIFTIIFSNVYTQTYNTNLTDYTLCILKIDNVLNHENAKLITKSTEKLNLSLLSYTDLNKNEALFIVPNPSYSIEIKNYLESENFTITNTIEKVLTNDLFYEIYNKKNNQLISEKPNKIILGPKEELTNLFYRKALEIWIEDNSINKTVDEIINEEENTTKATCSYSICLEDTYGDSWNGGSVNVVVGGVTVISGATLSSGYGPVCYNFTVNTGQTIVVQYTGGSYTYENYYSIYNGTGGSGTLVYSSGSGYTPPTSQNITNNCGGVTPPTNSGDICIEAEPFCTGSTYTFPMNTGNTSETGPDYTCLLSQPNPYWYYLLIDNSGNIDIYMESPTGNDIDFTCWGPFTSPSGPCTAQLTSGNTVDCSFSALEYETCNISNAIHGQYYLMLITNYSNAAGTIEFSQTGGTGTTNCNIVYCDMTALTANAGVCNSGTNTYTASGTITFSGAPTTGTLVVTDAASGLSQTINAPFTSPTNYSIPGISANGAGHTITAAFSDAPTCSLTQTYTAPPPCNICTTNAGADQTRCGLTTTLSATTNAGDYNTFWSPVAGITYGNTSSATSTITATTAGTYNLTWNVTNSSGNTCSDNVSITFVNPSASITYNGNQCLTGNSYNFTNTGTHGASYSWSFPSGSPASSTTENPTGVTWSSAGTYTVTLTVTQGTCTATATQIVTVYGQPTATVTPTNALCFGICNGSAIVNGSGGSGTYTNYVWNTGPTTQSITGLCPNTYSVTITDSYGCTGVGSGTVSQPTALSIVTSRSNPTCNGACNGTAQATVSGGSSSYSYAWSNLGSTANLTNLCSGTYTVTVTDNSGGAGCTQTASVVLTDPAAMVLSSSVIDATCGAANGSATVSIVSGGVPNYSYSWSNGSTTPSTASTTNTITGLNAGAYIVTITDNSGCTATRTINVNSTGSPTASISSSSAPLCFGACNGTATVSISGTLNSPFNYVWSTGTNTPGSIATTNTVSNLCNGTSTVTITDALGCVATASVTLVQPAQVNASTSTTNSTCGMANGSATVNAIGGTGSYTYNWMPGTLSTASISGQLAGTYNVTVTDGNGCSTTSSATIGNTAGVSASISGTTQPSCFGGSNGTATATGTGGTLPYTYVWAPGGQTSATAINLSQGTYTVTITDASLCTSVVNTTIGQPTVVTATISGTINATCNGTCNGSATVTPGGGTPTYLYSWSNGQSTSTASNICSGNHLVTVTDANGCTATTSATITQPTAVTASTTSISAHCNLPDGSATATGNNGTPGYTYQWDAAAGNQTNATATGLAPGSYTVTVRDANNCSVTTTANVGNQPAGTALISNTTHVTCNGLCNGSITVSMSGGTAPYTYLWNPSGQTNTTATNLCAGNYTVTVTDASGCTVTTASTVNQPSLLSVNITATDILCFGGCDGNLNALAAGGTSSYNYQWSNTVFTANNSNLCAGTYVVTTTDALGCTATNSYTLSTPPAMTISGTPSPANCNQSDGSLTITVTNGAGPFIYTWNPAVGASSTLTNIPAGNYSVTVTDSKGCTATGSYIVPNTTGVTVSLLTKSNVSCFGLCDGMASVSTTGGTLPYSYIWNDPFGQTTAIATNLCAGTYSVTVTDQNLCSATLNVPITQPTVLTLANITGSNPLCNGDCNGVASAIITGGTPPYTYTWTGGVPFGGNNSTASSTGGICNGNMILNANDANGCIVSGSIQIIEPSFISLSISVVNETCSGMNNGQITVNTIGGTPPYTYQWGASAGGQTGNIAQNLTSGTHTVTVTDANGCTETISGTVNSPNPLVFTSTTPTHLSCFQSNNGSIGINVSGGTPAYTFNWTNSIGTFTSSSQNIGFLPAETYTVTVTDLNGCNITQSIIISQPPQMTLSLFKQDESCYQFCDGEIISNTNGGQLPYTYLWSNLNTNANLTSACPGNYILTVTDNNGCTVSSNATIIGPPLLQIDLINSTNATCGLSNGSAQIGFQGGTTGYSITWSPLGGNGVIASNLPANNYTATVIDLNGCIASIDVSIQNLNGPIITNFIPTHVSCAGYNNGVAIVSYSPSNPPAPPYTTTWSNSWVGDTASNLQGGLYYVTVSDNNGCISTGSIIIEEPTNLVSVINSSTNNQCFGQCIGTASVLVGGGVAPYSYNWLGIGQHTSSVSNLCTGDYNVIVTDNNGCTSVNTVTITQPTEIDITANITHAQCNGYSNGVISLDVTGGTPVYQFNWTPTSTSNTSTVSNLYAGQYTVIVSDIWNCTSTQSYFINQPDPIFSYTTVTPASCGLDNGTARIDSTTGGTPSYTFVWSPTNLTTTNISNLPEGVYILQVTDANGCTGSISVPVGMVSGPQNVTFTSTNVLCNGTSTGTITANPVGGTSPFTYLWENNQTDQTAINLEAGTYFVTITDANNCSTIASTSITQPSPILVFTIPSDTICINQTAVISANASGGVAPYTFHWTGPGMTNPTGPIQQVNPSSTSNYSVYAVDINGCVSTPPAVITVPVFSNINAIISPDALICQGQNHSILVTAYGGKQPYNYTWNIGSGNPNVVTPNDTATYIAIITDACSTPADTVTMTIFVKNAPSLLSNPFEQHGCTPLVGIFNANVDTSYSNVTYLWDFGDPSSPNNNSTTQSATHYYGSPGTYDVILTLSDGTCPRTYLFDDLVEVYPIPDADFYASPVVTDVFHSNITFFDQSNQATQWLWYFGDGEMATSPNISHIYESAGTFEVILIVKSEKNCADTAKVNITIQEAHTMYAPDAFSPGNGFTNNYFYPKGIGFDPKEYNLLIFDRWGQTIFKTSVYPEGTSAILEQEGGWNGKYNGTGDFVPVGTYAWYVKCRDVNGGYHEYYGTVSVVR